MQGEKDILHIISFIGKHMYVFFFIIIYFYIIKIVKNLPTTSR